MPCSRAMPDNVSPLATVYSSAEPEEPDDFVVAGVAGGVAGVAGLAGSVGADA